RHTVDVDARAVDRLADAVQRVADAIDDEVRHRRVDVAGELDETAFEPALARLPRQIERVDRNAVPAEAGAGIERHEAERLRLRGFDDLPDVDVHRVTHLRVLVHQPDIDGAECVFEKLHHLGDAGRTDRYDITDDLRVQRRRRTRTGRAVTAENLRNVARGVGLVTGVDTFRREREKEIAIG